MGMVLFLSLLVNTRTHTHTHTHTPSIHLPQWHVCHLSFQCNSKYCELPVECKVCGMYRETFESGYLAVLWGEGRGEGREGVE